jgi:heme-degrading monooxygenase HmoA
MPDAAEPSIVVDTWVVADGSQDEFVAALCQMFARLEQLDGFVRGTLLEGVDRTRFVTFARMRSAREREDAFLDPEIEAMMRRIGGIAHASPHAYSVVRRFGAGDSPDG